MNNTTDNFELIAQDAVTSLTAAAITLKMIGIEELATALANDAEALCERAIALGAE